MIKHLIKLVWNRKRANLLIGIEIFVSFLVLFAIMVLIIYCIDNYRRPLGFSYGNVWNIEIEMKREPAGQPSERAETMRQLYLSLKELNEIEAVAGAQYQPFTPGGNYGIIRNQAAEIRFRNNTVTDDFDRVLGVKLERGRWFGRQDDGADPPPVVINQKLAREVFGAEDPVGRVIESSVDNRMRVIGLVADFRHGGEFFAPENLVFLHQNGSDPQARPERDLLIKLRPGITRAFEERLVRRLQDVAPEWSFEVTPLTELRESLLQQTWIPMAAACVVAIFLMIMVALGLTGVLWQNVTQRTREIGLRRAHGATVSRIYQQVLGELLIITSFSLLAGVAVIVQFPLLDLVGGTSGQVYGWSILISLVIIYLLTIACGLYPSWLATRVQPATALHYE